MPLHVSSTCAHRQEVKIVLYGLWYHHTYRWLSRAQSSLNLHSCASACKTNTTQNHQHQISNTQRTENKTTDVVIQQHSRKLLMMDILMSET